MSEEDNFTKQMKKADWELSYEIKKLLPDLSVTSKKTILAKIKQLIKEQYK